MRQSIAAILIAGAVAQGQGQPQAQLYDMQAAQQGMQTMQTMQVGVPQLQQMQGVPQMPQGMQGMQGVPQLQQGQTFTLPASAQGLQGQPMPGQLPQQAQQGLTTASLAPRVKGIPIGTAQGVTDSDRACKAGVVSACGLPNVPNMWNEDPNMRYQTQQSDQLLWQIYETGNYAANGQRVVNQNPVGIDIPYYQSGSANGGNFGAVYTVNPNDPYRRPVNSLVNYVTNDGRAPEGFRPSASNAVLPSSSAHLWANANPQATTPVNTVTGAGFGYSDKINAPGVSPVFTGGNWNVGVPAFNQGFMGNQGFLGNVGQNLGFFGNAGQNWNLGNAGQNWNLGNAGQNWNLGNAGQNWNLGNVAQVPQSWNFGTQVPQSWNFGTQAQVPQSWNLGGQAFLAPRSSNLGFSTVNTGLRPGGAFGNYMPNYAPPTQNRLPTLPNGQTVAPAWTPTTGTGYNGPNVPPQAGQQPQQQPRWP